MIEEFLARSSVSRCADLRETADVISKVLKSVSHVVQTNQLRRRKLGETMTSGPYKLSRTTIRLVYSDYVGQRGTRLCTYFLPCPLNCAILLASVTLYCILFAQLGFKMFLGIQPVIGNWAPDGKEFSLVMDENPLSGRCRLWTACIKHMLGTKCSLLGGGCKWGSVSS